MKIPSRIQRPLFVVIASCLVVFTLGLLPKAVSADDENDPAVLRKRIGLLEDKVASLEEQLKQTQDKLKAAQQGGGDLTAEEMAKFKLFMNALPPEDRKRAEMEMESMPPAARTAAIRQVLSMPPGQIARAKKRSEATRTLEDLRLLDAATDQYAIETNKVTGFHPSFGDLKNYIKPGTTLYKTDADVFGNTYGPFTIDSIPLVPEATFNALSDVADQSFWTPYH